MQKSKKKTEFIPDEFKTIKEASDFWDTHDIADYWDDTKEVKFRASLKKEPKYVALEENIAQKTFNVAKKKHISMETLVNLWLKEKLSAAR
ncbi:MAG: hypothetical protein A2X59_03270 [Nitrospirae bacterium GWC2_42_7]|nr:MAG: hypothetical protein A2X59_03270 [Nitrospirae bacterium GWC2_42_7]